MNDLTFSGERLHAGSELFAVDLARHESAYEIARQRVDHGGRLLELGSGSGYGAASLAAAGLDVVAIDRVAPDAANRQSRCHFLRGDLNALPLIGGNFELIVSFQVIEHLVDPTAYVNAIADLCGPDGSVLITTPNRLMSDGVNPFHVHEYVADELAECLKRRFAEVKIEGIGASPAVRDYMKARSTRIRRIMKLDPLGLRDRLPRHWIEWLFARFALLVRSGTGRESGTPDVSWRDFPVGPADDQCLDLLATCRRPC